MLPDPLHLAGPRAHTSSGHRCGEPTLAMTPVMSTGTTDAAALHGPADLSNLE